jgi:hypothetical protein
LKPKKESMRALWISFFLFLFSVLSCFIGTSAHAQLDPATELLLSHDLSDDQKAGLQSGRYEIRPSVDEADEDAQDGAREPAQADNDSDFKIRLKPKKASKKAKKKKVKTAAVLPSKKVTGEEKQIEDPIEGTTVVTPATLPVIPTPTRPPLAVIKNPTTTTMPTPPTPTTLPAPQATPVVATPAAVPAPQAPPASATMSPVTTPPPTSAATAPAPTAESPAAKEEAPSWREQLKELVYTQPKEIQEYKEKIHPDDNRLNQIEINLLPGVISMNSKSNLDYRDFKATSPAWLVGGEFWLTPFMGLYGSYTSTVGGDIGSSATSGDKISAQQEWTEIGFDLRKYFGMSRRAKSISFGVDYTGSKLTVPSDSTYREDLSSDAIGFHVLARLPVAPNYAWTFGGRLAPRVNVSEKNTALNLSSGSSPQAIRVGANVGGEFKMSRAHQLVWQLSLSYEKVKYGDQSNLPDLGTGSPVSGVSIDSTTTFLQFGYRWGQ